MAVTRCGISSRQLSRDLGVTVKTGWRMFHQIRRVLVDDEGKLSGEVEVDETYIGGKARNMHKAKRDQLSGRGTAGKTPLLGMVERNGRVRGMIIPIADTQTLETEVQANIEPGTAVLTDGHAGYDGLTKLGYQHESVPHSQGIYVLGKDIHTNSIEGFWSQLKRSIDGSYHHVTVDYLPLYVDEYAFRYTHRNEERNMFWLMMERVISEAS